MKNTLLIIVLSTFVFQSLQSQNQYDIVFPQNRDQVCQQFNQAFVNRPKEVKFSIVRVNSSLFFETNNKQWFDQLFQNTGDGLAIDVVSRDRYNCENVTINNTQIRGTLLKPIYAQKLKRGLKKTKDNKYQVLIGRIPSALINDELEFNILFLNNKNLCQYYIIYDLEAYPWDLLDMGMYLDSLTYNSRSIKPNKTEAYIIKNKTLKFQIPFQKNKSEYSQNDIKPLYDSLQLTDFNIKAIRINAYSSVEGSLERNIQLQEQRANSIVNALQTFQKPTIKTEISSSENWVEFLNDIENTEHQYLSKLSKSKIKSKLIGKLSSTLEPILKNHRKAVIELQLQKKDKYKTMSADQLLNKFNTSIAANDLNEALVIQNSIFEKLNNKVISPDFLRKTEVPKQAKFLKILNKNSAFKFMSDVRQVLIVYNELKELDKLVPKNKEVKYNLASVKFKLWRHNAIKVDENKFKTEIYALKNYGIDEALISRMMLNFHIIKAENLMRKRDYKKKDISVAYINKNYKKVTLSDYDYLSLAQFFAFYANTDLSVKLLEEKAKSIDINEDLLYYYLNLTISNETLTQTSDYRTIMLNAYNMNAKRYCKLFNTFGKGGVMFQLLENEYLRSTYCENCIN
ncbi:OmpA family protein [Ichthyenterobacterium magnum]|uniref:OmpA family protein n=1 Tax=Ichthyenterobacterium magnum TaxID=1230530 RepID=A0A420DXY4_9FLAO|nr:hypothetical protein [Ichthyenterobacterium magnum]RKE99041.1 hypothetical protein BXY80_1142 [Ichthyenterobacterium magnum]